MSNFLFFIAKPASPTWYTRQTQALVHLQGDATRMQPTLLHGGPDYPFGTLCARAFVERY